MIDDLTLSYLAGFFDGEGSVTVHVKRDRALITLLTITNCDRRVLDLGCSLYGGRVRLRKRGVGSERHRPIFDWQISGADSERLATDLLRFTRIKTPQLRLYLEARTLVSAGSSPVSEEAYDRRDAIASDVTRLKRVV